MNADKVAEVHTAGTMRTTSDRSDSRDSGVVRRAGGVEASQAEESETSTPGAASANSENDAAEHDVALDDLASADKATSTENAEPSSPRAAAPSAVTANGVGANGVNSNGADSTASGERSDDETFEVSDDEIQTAEESDRISLLPQLPNVMRHRPPPPPSMRPRPASTPARAQSQHPAEGWGRFGSQAPRSGLSGQKSQPAPAEDTRWLLANRTLELTRVKARCAELEGLLAQRDARIAALEQELQQALAGSAKGGNAAAKKPAAGASAQARPAATPAAAASAQPAPAKATPYEAKVAPQEAKAASQEEAAPLSVDSRWPSSTDDDSRDSAAGDETPAAEAAEELGRISGIGPVLAKTLRAQGVTRLAQIAAWSEDDIRRIAKAIKVPKSRISRGRWVQKAREALGRGGDESPSSSN